MLTSSELEHIHEAYGSEYLLRQLAEECGELVQAALHLVRAEKRETIVDEPKARLDLIEEMADVYLMMNCVRMILLCHDERMEIEKVIDQKSYRMVRRLLDDDWTV